MTGSKRDGFEKHRQAILAALLDLAPFEGWSRPALLEAAREAGADRATLTAAFPRGVSDILTYWSEAMDEEMTTAMSGTVFENLRIREKVSYAITERLKILRPHKEAARRAAATLALPFYGLLGARLAWRTADAVWRGLGDKSTDFNFYSKRAILTGVWTSVFARWLADDSGDEAPTQAFLAARIENVMQIEKLKGRMRKAGIDPEKPLGWVAKLRYPKDNKEKAHETEKVDEALDESYPASDPPYYSGGKG